MIGVILVGYGAPDSPEAVEPFLKSIAGGRSFTREQIDKTVEKYRLIGGKSPLVRITERQAVAVEKELNSAYNNYSVFFGMLHWKPYIGDTIKSIIDRGILRIAVVTLAPFNSRASTGAYFKEVDKALQKHPHIETVFVSGWQNNDIYHIAMKELIGGSLSEFDKELCDDLQIVFTVHSLPQSYIDQGDPYVKEVTSAVERIAALCNIKNYHIAYQSKGRGGEWLEPDFGNLLDNFAVRGIKNVLTVPIGFISDHLETLYDLDIVYREYAEARGIKFVRAPALNDSKLLAAALADEILRKTSQWDRA